MTAGNETKEREEALRRLLLRMFSVSELQRFIRFGPRGEELSLELPGPTASASETATAVVTVLVREKAVDRALFERLIEERPRRRDEILAVQSRFLAEGAEGGKVIEMKAR